MSDNSRPFGRRSSVPDGQSAADTRQWIYDEANVSLSNRALDAELKLAMPPEKGEVQATPVATAFRLGNVRLSMLFQRQQVMSGSSHSGPPLRVMWWSGSYGTAQVSDGSARGVYVPEALKKSDWMHLDPILTDGLRTFTALIRRDTSSAPASHLVHLGGGYIGGEWSPRFFRSLGDYEWYPVSDQRRVAMRNEIARRTPIPQPWRFEDGTRPRVVHDVTGDVIFHERGDGPNAVPFPSKHVFRYQGRLGDFELPVTFKPVFAYTDHPKPVAWELDYASGLQTRSGSARGRLRDGTIQAAVPGEARLPQAEWQAFNETITEGLLSWPAHAGTGPAPIWLKLNGAYREGAWVGSTISVVGTNAETTGLVNH